MQYTEEELGLARQLRSDGLEWVPQAGNYVYDETEFCKQTSPFQDRVYFILNYPYFMKAVGGVDRFKEMMTWLPTWEEAREILRALGVPDQEVFDNLAKKRAIENGSERLTLYRMIASSLSKHTAAS